MLFKFVKDYFVHKWAKEISTRAVYRSIHSPGTIVDSTQKNIMGDGGTRKPYSITWHDLFDQCKNQELINTARAKKYLAVKEYLFFAYFGPLEHWCEHNFSSKFMLWHDDNAVYCVPLTDQDQMLWMLVWDNKMPQYDAIQDEYSSS